MKRIYFSLLFLICTTASAMAGDSRKVINLNGTWEFEQTTLSIQPSKFSRKIPVPGLAHLAQPRIEEYEKFFKRAEDSVDGGNDRPLFLLDYTPRYSWYRKKVMIGNDMKGLEAVLTIKKSQYATQVIVNGIDMGSFVECYTPIDVVITRALKFGAENEIIIKVGDRYWLPAQAAGGTDKEKVHYIPGIWDDVLMSFTGKMRVHRLLALPLLKDKKVTVKAKIWNLNRFEKPSNPKFDSVKYTVNIYEKVSRKLVATATGSDFLGRDQQSEVSIDVPVKTPKAWSPEMPFMYTAEMVLQSGKSQTDTYERGFGMRDFERRGKAFFLNGERYYLRGSNITLQRFFEDPDCGNLAWDKAWVKKMMVDNAKELNWNAMRICVSIVPDFWYDMADENGILLQNEWLYWQMHGWNEQIRKEYTDWVWNDGSHPSIAIWDGINENYNQYIGNTLIPELKKLDPTRIWDAGYMTASLMQNDEMDEPHTYQGRAKDIKDAPYPLGNLKFRPEIVRELEESGSAQLVNEYGWVWLWRDGRPARLTTGIYNYYIGPNSTTEQRFKMQAYWLQAETEWMRSNHSVAGLLAFCLLTNNYGYTGDWFTGNVKYLNPSETMYWFKHCFAPVNVFLNVTDERYARQQAVHKPGGFFSFNFVAVNDLPKTQKGELTIKLLDSKGGVVYTGGMTVALPKSDRIDIPYSLSLPQAAGGYLLLTEFTPEGSSEKLMSRRYIKIGQQDKYDFYEMPVPAKYISYTAAKK